MKKVCEVCGIEYESKHISSKYCSAKCRNQSKKKPKTCKNCGSLFMSKNRHARFCSNKCSQIYRYKENHITLSCVACGKQFDRIKSKIRSEFNYCSEECFRKAEKPYIRRSATVTCANCGKEFERQFYLLKERYNYCSHKCYAEHIVKLGLRSGENNPNYNHNLTKEEREIGRNYVEYYEWRIKVFERDNYTCQKCGGRGVTLHAHHIFNYATHKELRTDINNGITLCSKCHKRFHEIYGNINNNDKQLKEFLREIC